MQSVFKNKFLLVIIICSSLLTLYFVIQKNFLSTSSVASEDIAIDISVDHIEDSNIILDIKDCGDSIGSLNDVTVYLNSGGIMSCDGVRNLNPDGYSYGIKWQCVEFVRRYYYDYLDHKMPNRYGHASDYFRRAIPSGSMNSERNLLQYHNGDIRPQKNDILVWAGTYGHVAIVINVTDTTVSTIAQNVGENCIEDLSLNENTISGGCVGFLRKQTTQD
tara:strand:- start:132 stop:788 length:657 start_codon:yes stop_codon:yes gene_type:complete